MSGWIVGTRTAGDQASTRRCLIALDKVTMIEEGHGGGIVVHLEGQMPEVLVTPGFEEIEERLTAPRPWRVDEVRASMAADRERAEREGQGA